MPKNQAQQGEELESQWSFELEPLCWLPGILFRFLRAQGSKLTAALLLQNRIQFAILSFNLSLKHM